jgi:hypothetical protein
MENVSLRGGFGLMEFTEWRFFVYPVVRDGSPKEMVKGPCRCLVIGDMVIFSSIPGYGCIPVLVRAGVKGWSV